MKKDSTKKVKGKSKPGARAVLRIARVILLFPLALFRLALIFIISLFLTVAGQIWLTLFGFSKKLLSLIMKSWGRSIIFICGIKVYKNRVPSTGNFIIMPNHRSYLDIFLVAAYTPAAFVMKSELMKWPLLKTSARITNSIFVSRSDIKSLISTMHNIKSSIDKQIPVAIFPEGTTGKGPLTRPFKNGSFKIAADAKIMVIPMAIHYKDGNDSWINDDTFVGHFLRQMSKPVTEVAITYGSPIYNSDYKKLQKETKEQIDQMLSKLEN